MTEKSEHQTHGPVGRLLRLGILAFFALAVLEGLFRYAIFPEYRALQQSVFTPHPVIEVYNKPNLELRRFSPMNYDVVNRTNSLGFRGAEADMEDDLAGLWVVGDSNTFAAGVADDETYPARLKGYGYRAANLASEGLRLERQVLTVRYFQSLGYRPRAVVAGLSLPQCIRDFAPFLDHFTEPVDPDSPSGMPETTARARLTEQVQKVRNLVPLSFMQLRAKLIKSSAIYGWLKVGILGVPALREWTKEAGLRTDLDLVVKGSLNLRRPFDGDNPMAPLVRSTADYVARFQGYVGREMGVPFGVVLFPTYHQLYPEKFDKYLAVEGVEEPGLDPQNSRRALVKALRDRGVPVLDLQPVLVGSGVEPLTFPDDAHLNPQAHAVVAGAVADFVGKRLGVPPRR